MLIGHGQSEPFLASPTKLNIGIHAIFKLGLQIQHVLAFSRKLTLAKAKRDWERGRPV